MSNLAQWINDLSYGPVPVPVTEVGGGARVLASQAVAIPWYATGEIDVTIDVSRALGPLSWTAPAGVLVSYYDPSEGREVHKLVQIGGFGGSQVAVRTGAATRGEASWGEITIQFVPYDETSLPFIGRKQTLPWAISQTFNGYKGLNNNGVYDVTLISVEAAARLDPIGPGPSSIVRPECFPSGVEIAMWDGSKKSIENIRPGDVVASFDPTIVGGSLTAGKVTRVFDNITDTFLVLSSGLVVTPGHHFQRSDGSFGSIENILHAEGEVVLESGELVTLTGERVQYSAQSATAYEQAEGYKQWAEGALATSPSYTKGWRTYNFEVEGFHTYIAGGVRVHNQSVFTSSGADLTIGGTYVNKSGDRLIVNANGSITNVTTGHTTAAPAYADGKYKSVNHAEADLGRNITPAEQNAMASEGAFARHLEPGRGATVTTASGAQASAGTIIHSSSGYTYIVNSDGSLTNMQTGHKSGVGTQRYNADTNTWETVQAPNTGSASTAGTASGSSPGQPQGGKSGQSDHGTSSSSGSSNSSSNYNPNSNVDRATQESDWWQQVTSSPVLLDLDGDGIEVTTKSSSNTYFDMADDGLKYRTAWAGVGDGVLVFDANDDGIINQRKELDFTEWAAGARSDMEALRAAFDTNHDGMLTASDADWALFKVLVTNADGTTTLRTMSELGITSIGLISNNQEVTLADGSKIHGTTNYTTTSGTGIAADTSLAFDPTGYLVTETVTVNGDGSTTIKSVARRADGHIAETITSTISSDGSERTIVFDVDGDGVTDRVREEARVINGDGSRTDSVEEFDGSGTVLKYEEVTDTSADLKTVTVSRDFDGSGAPDQIETRATDINGTLTTTITNLNADSSTRNQSTVVTSSDGLSKTIATELTGTGITNATRTINTSVAGDGTRTETLTDYAGSTVSPSTRIGSTVTVIGTDGSKTVSTDLDGDGTVDLSTQSIVVHNVDGSDTTTRSVYNGDSSLRQRVITHLSADGNTETTQTDIDGDGNIDNVLIDMRELFEGEVYRTITKKSSDGTILDEKAYAWAADGTVRMESLDSDGDGEADEAVVAVIFEEEGGIEISTSSSADGSTLLRAVITTTSADGLSRTIEVDADGDSYADSHIGESTVINMDGSSTTTTITKNGDDTIQIAKVVETTSADGLSVTTQNYLGTAVSPFATLTDVTVQNIDGSLTRTTVSYEGTSLAQVGKLVTLVSADRLTTTIEHFVGTNSLPDTIETSVTAASGARTNTLSTFSTDGAMLLSKTTTVVSADGLTRTMTVDADGNTTINGTFVSTRTYNVDGTVTVVEANYAGAATASVNKVGQVTTTTSGNGLIATRIVDADGDGTADSRVVSSLTYNADGSQTTSVTTQNGDGTIQTGRVTSTVSDDGLAISRSVFLSDHTTADSTSADVNGVAADGTTTQVSSSFSGNGSLISRTTNTKSGDGLARSSIIDLDGDDVTDRSVSTTVASDSGTITSIVSTYADGGALASRATSIVSGNGLSVSTAIDLDGDGTTDRSTTDVVTLNTDGSKTRTQSTFNASESLRDKTTTTTSADGLTTTTLWDGMGGGTTTRSRVTSSVVNSDGSTAETISHYNANGSLHDRWILTINATGLTTTTTEDIDGNGVVDHTTVRARNTDGSLTISRMDGSVLSAAGRLYGSQRGSYLTINATGLITTTLFDANGDSLAERQVKSVKVLNADGTTVDTITRSILSGGTPGAANPSYTETLKERAVVTTSVNGLSTNTQWDLTGGGTLTDSKSDAVVLNADGSRTQTTSLFTGATLKGRYELTESADGLSRIVRWDTSGSGAFAEVSSESTVTSADGVTTRTVINSTNTGSLISKFVTITSADGRTVVVQRDFDGSGVFTEIETTKTVTGADGSTTVATTFSGPDGVIQSRTIVVTSGDGADIVITRDANGDGHTDQTELVKNAVDGTTTRVVTDWSGSGTKLSQVTTTIQADHLSATSLSDIEGDGINDRSTVRTWSYNADGSTTETAQVYKISDKIGGVATTISPVLQQKVTISTSADGAVTTTTIDVDGNGSVDETSTTTRNIDGSTVTTITDNAAARALPPPLSAVIWTSAVAATDKQVAAATTITVSNDGNKKTVQADYDGNGTYEHTETWTTRVDGSQVAIIADKNGSGTTVASGKKVVSADGRTTTLAVDTDMNGTQDHVESSILRVDGGYLKSVADYNASGILLKRVISTVSSNGEVRALNITGGAVNETLIGVDGDDILDGGGGSDTLIGGKGNDTYFVDNVSDVVTENANEGIDTVNASFTYTLGANLENLTLLGSAAMNGTGNASDNILIGNTAANTLTGNDGNDWLDGGAGADTLVGGAGNDTYVVDNAGDVVTEASSAGTDIVRALITYTLGANLENLTLIGSAAIDGTGNSLNNVITGNAVNNVLNGGAGSDTIVGGAGDDVLIGGSGADVLIGGDGIDTASYATATSGISLNTDPGANGDTGDAAGDTFESIEIFRGTAYADSINVTANNTTIYGGDGDDLLSTSGEGLTALGEGGGDEIQGSDSADIVDGGDGNDLIYGWDGSDLIIGGNGDDRLYAGDGDDVIDGGAGADIIDGGEGIDTVSYAGASSGIYIHMGYHPSTFTGDAAGDILSNIEIGRGTNYADDITVVTDGMTIYGGAGNDILNTWSWGGTSLYGEAGDDIISGDAGADYLDGGDDNDTIYGFEGDDVIVGGDGADTLYGDEGADHISGGEGHDALFGGEGDDVLVGGAGADAFDGGNGTDTVSYADATAGVYIHMGYSSSTFTGDAKGDTFNNIEIGRGTNYADDITVVTDGMTIYGGAGNDTLNTWAWGGSTFYGEAGDDVISGDAGADYLDGGSDNDTILGFEGDDVIVGGDGDDLLHGDQGADTLSGGGDEDEIFGDDGNDTMDGGAGNDVLAGGAGADILTGGAGSDTFYFAATSHSGITYGTRDVITDFAAGDFIRLQDIDANTDVGGHQTFVLDTNSSFSAGEIRQTVVGSDLLVEMNTNSDSTPEMSILLLNRTALLSASDFIL